MSRRLSRLMKRLGSRHDEHGLVSVEFTAAIGLSLLVVVLLTNLILVQYGRGIMRAAADESARVGSVVIDNDTGDATAIARCQQRQQDVLKGLGKLGTVTASNCAVANGQITTTISASFDGWLPGMPALESTVSAVSVKEQAPQ